MRFYHEKSKRCSMYSDLADKNLPIGMPKQKVTALLGIGENAFNHPECIDYPLGYCSGLHIDLDLLRICFDENDKIETVIHYQS